jgi:hypothetical protein
LQPRANWRLSCHRRSVHGLMHFISHLHQSRSFTRSPSSKPASFSAVRSSARSSWSNASGCPAGRLLSALWSGSGCRAGRRAPGSASRRPTRGTPRSYRSMGGTSRKCAQKILSVEAEFFKQDLTPVARTHSTVTVSASLHTFLSVLSSTSPNGIPSSTPPLLHLSKWLCSVGI